MDPWEGDVDTVLLDRSNFTRCVPPSAAHPRARARRRREVLVLKLTHKGPGNEQKRPTAGLRQACRRCAGPSRLRMLYCC